MNVCDRYSGILCSVLPLVSKNIQNRALQSALPAVLEAAAHAGNAGNGLDALGLLHVMEHRIRVFRAVVRRQLNRRT